MYASASDNYQGSSECANTLRRIWRRVCRTYSINLKDDRSVAKPGLSRCHYFDLYSRILEILLPEMVNRSAAHRVLQADWMHDSCGNGVVCFDRFCKSWAHLGNKWCNNFGGVGTNELLSKSKKLNRFYRWLFSRIRSTFTYHIDKSVNIPSTTPDKNNFMAPRRMVLGSFKDNIGIPTEKPSTRPRSAIVQQLHRNTRESATDPSFMVSPLQVVCPKLHRSRRRPQTVPHGKIRRSSSSAAEESRSIVSPSVAVRKSNVVHQVLFTMSIQSDEVNKPNVKSKLSSRDLKKTRPRTSGAMKTVCAATTDRPLSAIELGHQTWPEPHCERNQVTDANDLDIPQFLLRSHGSIDRSIAEKERSWLFDKVKLMHKTALHYKKLEQNFSESVPQDTSSDASGQLINGDTTPMGDNLVTSVNHQHIHTLHKNSNVFTSNKAASIMQEMLIASLDSIAVESPTPTPIEMRNILVVPVPPVASS